MENFRYEDGLYQSYFRANQAFADAVAKVYAEGNYIWVHDYHLMLMPGMLRARVPNAKIGESFVSSSPSPPQQK